jgi:hypothetical protein
MRAAQIPVPLETNKVESLSRQTVHLWTGRDAPHLGDDTLRTHERNGSVHSNVRTVVAPRSAPPSLSRAVVDGETDSHQMICDNCEEVTRALDVWHSVVADTPSSSSWVCAISARAARPRQWRITWSVSIRVFSDATLNHTQCTSCEPRSYIVHDPMHIFFKLPRPVHRPLQSAMPFLPSLYKQPVGPAFGNADPTDPAGAHALFPRYTGRYADDTVQGTSARCSTSASHATCASSASRAPGIGVCTAQRTCARRTSSSIRMTPRTSLSCSRARWT